MKSLIMIAILTLSTVSFAQSRDFSEVARSVIVNLYGTLPGDQISVTPLGVRNSSFDVSITNGASAGSMLYNVEIDETPTSDAGGDIAATIKVRNLGGN